MIELYRCLDCQEIFSLIRPPQGQEFLGDISEEINLEFSYHREHNLENLKPVKGQKFSRDAYDAPRRKVYFMVTNGKEQFLVVKSKKSLVGPCSYEIKQGFIQQTPPEINLRTEDILKQIIWEKKNSAPEAEKIAEFINMLKETVSVRMASSLVQEVADLHHPLLSYGQPPRSFIDNIIHQCRSKFSEETACWFVDFINRHKDSYGPLWIEIKRDFEVIEESIFAVKAIGCERSTGPI